MITPTFTIVLYNVTLILVQFVFWIPSTIILFHLVNYFHFFYHKIFLSILIKFQLHFPIISCFLILPYTLV